jgi:hypothetical protein
MSVVWPQNHWDGFSRFDLKTSDNDFFQFGLKTGGFIPGLGLKVRSYGLVIMTLKSQR